jgi:SAM-dependent methyltransferase
MNEPTGVPSRTILQTVGEYYADRLQRFGPTPRGVDWNSAESQELRFSRLLEVVSPDDPSVCPSLLDIGCGYGALLEYVRGRSLSLDYRGFDISEPMIAAARARHGERPGATFASDVGALAPATYVVASGIFNVKLSFTSAQWRAYVLDTLTALDRWSIAGFAFNMLSTHSDPGRRRDDLYYANPRHLFHLCTRRFSPRVALLHDYHLFEFTVIVRK